MRPRRPTILVYRWELKEKEMVELGAATTHFSMLQSGASRVWRGPPCHLWRPTRPVPSALQKYSTKKITRERCLRQSVTLLDGLTADLRNSPAQTIFPRQRLQVQGVILILFRIPSPAPDRAIVYFDVVPISNTLHSIFYGCR